MSNLDFISRSELLAEIDQERKRHIDSGNYGAEHLMVHSLRRLAEEAPAVDTAPVVHARWVWADDGYCRCSNCTQKAPVMTQYQDEPMTTMTDYCPDCGAKMDKEG